MKRNVILAAAIVTAAIMCFALVQFARLQVRETQTERQFDSLRQVLHPMQTDPEKESPPSDGAQIDPRFAELLSAHPDLVGWITVEGTAVDYPVMQNKEDGEYYLRRDLNGKSSRHGVPFLDRACDVQTSDNLIVYGHHMRDGTMFAGLMNFTDAAFCERHPEIRFDTPYGAGRYRAVVVFRISAEKTVEFPYHKITDLSSGAQTAEDYVARCLPYALWYDKTVPLAGAKLLTLSTCEYATSFNGRLVVVAVKTE